AAAVAPGSLLAGLPARQRVWMSHGDTCVAAPPGFEVTASTGATPVAVIEDGDRKLFGVQFHPEVMHTDHGQAVLQRFLDAAVVQPGWHHRRTGRAHPGPG